MIFLWSLPGWTHIVQTVTNINNPTDNIIKFSDSDNSILTYVTKVTGVSTGAAGATKGSVNLLEAVAC
jgi:hypothetical protein